MPLPPPTLDPASSPLHAFAERLRVLRANRGNPSFLTISRRIGAGVEGVSSTALSRYFNGEQLPAQDVLEHVLTALNVAEPEEFAAWEEIRTQAARRLEESILTQKSVRAERDMAWRSYRQAFTFGEQAGLEFEAFKVAQIAISQFRDLVKAALVPSEHSPMLADYQTGLACALAQFARLSSRLGRTDDALKSAYEAVEISALLTTVSQEQFEPHLAWCKVNLASVMSDAGQHKQAILAARQAVDSYFRLANNAPDKYLGHVGEALSQLGLYLFEDEQKEQAAEMLESAVEAYQMLPDGAQESHKPDMARAFQNLGAVLAVLERWRKGFQATERAIRIYRELSQAGDADFESKLTSCLGNRETCSRALEADGTLSIALFEVGSYHECIDVCLRSLDAYRAAADVTSEARELNTLGGALGELDRFEESITAFRGAAEAWEKAGNRYNVATALMNLGISLRASGRLAEAQRSFEEAQEIFGQEGSVEEVQAVQQLIEKIPSTEHKLGKKV